MTGRQERGQDRPRPGREPAGQGAEAGRQADPDLSEEQAAEHEPGVNQRRDEPLPASREAVGDGPAVARNEELAAARPPHQAEPGRAESGQADQGRAEPGQAVRDLMGGPVPQGDVPDAPATQIAAADNEEDQVRRIRYVANAVPGKPDGEVDTRS